PIDGGFTSGCGFSRYNQEITITAEAYENREFKNWTENGEEVSTDAQYTFNVISNRNLVANFDRINGVEKMDGSDIIPQNYYISNAYPNPFNPETSFQFGLPEESFVKLIIFDISGQVVETVLDNSLVQAGNYINHFNAVNLPSGIYLFLINTNSAISDRSFKKSGKLLLLK
ncbi:MAG: T9SS type A sorting domain-containing protein, partial [Ignavibacteriae bacterium]|nr:T9SS type A sorting domain-containing protein [Ignavibacteriota bacterium]